MVEHGDSRNKDPFALEAAAFDNQQGGLVLSRKPGNSFFIFAPGTEAINIQILGIDKNVIRLLIKAPRSVRVLRTELLIEQNQSSASNTDPINPAEL